MSKRMSQLKLGFAPIGSPSDGVGPFKRLFATGVNLATVDSLKGVQAVILWGGEDISPSLYDSKPIRNSGPEEPSSRDLFEWEILTEAVKEKLPIIGICRGAQLACAFAGGKLIQHVENHIGGHHGIQTYDGTYQQVTTCHHQMMYPYSINHTLLGWMPEHRSKVYQPTETYESAELEQRLVKEPEVVYFNDINTLAIQGHPEWMDEYSPFNNWIMKEIRMRQLPLVE